MNQDATKVIDKKDEAPKVIRKGQGYKAENLLEDTTGINLLFKTMTIQSETIDHLRGKGHEVSDLNNIVNIFKTWHLNHNPKTEYYYFLERVRNHLSDKAVPPYLQKLRNHYKGTEMLEEFDLAFNNGGEDEVLNQKENEKEASNKLFGNEEPVTNNKRVKFHLEDEPVETDYNELHAQVAA